MGGQNLKDHWILPPFYSYARDTNRVSARVFKAYSTSRKNSAIVYNGRFVCTSEFLRREHTRPTDRSALLENTCNSRLALSGVQ